MYEIHLENGEVITCDDFYYCEAIPGFIGLQRKKVWREKKFSLFKPDTVVKEELKDFKFIPSAVISYVDVKD